MNEAEAAMWKKIEKRTSEALWFAAGDNTYQWQMTRPPGFIRLVGVDAKRNHSIAQEVPLQAVAEMDDNPLTQSVKDIAAELDKNADENPLTVN